MGMAVPKNPFEVRKSIAKPLSHIEQQVYDLCAAAAREGRPAPSIEELTIAVGATGVSTVPGIMKRLEAKGYITRQIYQRGRVVCLTSSGHCTLPPRNTSPHWRQRVDQVPAPAIQSVRQRMQSVASYLEARAKRENVSCQEMLMNAVYAGAHAMMEEEERGE